MLHGLPVKVRRDRGTFTATLPLRTRNGRTITLRVHCTVREAARELGYDPAELGAAFNPRDPNEWWRLVEEGDDDEPAELGGLDDDEPAELDTLGCAELGCLLAGQSEVEVGGKLWRRFRKRLRKFGRKLGKAFRKFARSKVVRGIAKIGRKLIKSPIFIGVASVLTGGLAAGPLAAANAAVSIIDAAKGPPDKPETKAARKLVKVALVADKQAQWEKAKAVPPHILARGKVQDGPWEGVYATPEQREKMDELVRVVAKARAARAAEERRARATAPIRVSPMPPAGEVQKWLVELGGLATW